MPACAARNVNLHTLSHAGARQAWSRTSQPASVNWKARHASIQQFKFRSVSLLTPSHYRGIQEPAETVRIKQHGRSKVGASPLRDGIQRGGWGIANFFPMLRSLLLGGQSTNALRCGRLAGCSATLTPSFLRLSVVPKSSHHPASSQQPPAAETMRAKPWEGKQRPARVRFRWLPVSIDWSMANPCPMGAAQRCEGLPIAVWCRRCSRPTLPITVATAAPG